ncbi:Uma2 family endonuclease [Thermoleptolyngbya sp. C42_A2020_037]|uniref:Uma2 family endonuclease n=1 Tax=Thermoleptolyngbya sp. C42_A2020_037 TaxID=2747799 RepID=UPI0019E50597|nr:Uma2 family endonuclease [Thermoleptolyngbya sp. C42_A2020_037]MBF2085772.1 Uma2 family endonuclease [Thermoleptolyngbya sp. C42_A2020_037]
MVQIPEKSTVIYPETDGEPMANNTEQFTWIVTIKENLELLFADDPDVFVVGDLLWYPVEGDNTLRQAPDAMVVFGRPKGRRGSYLQWREANIPPQVVFEILSLGNTLKEMAKKFRFYEQYGVEEYYLYDPDKIDLSGWLRSPAGRLDVIEEMDGWVSPRLQIRFEPSESSLQIFRPDGQPFLTFVELETLRLQAQQQAEQAEQRAEQAQQRAEQAERRAERLAERLRALGLIQNLY